MPRATISERGERTRAAILDAAEAEFADRGLAGARVDSIARSVGIHRASLFYYYPDKASLYAAVVEDRVLPYFERIQKLLALGETDTGGAGRLDLIVQGVSLQAEFIARNPRLAKIFLREISDFDPAGDSHLARLIRPLMDQVILFLEEKRREGLCNPIDPEHLVTAVAGSTLLQIVARPILHPRRRNAALSEEELELHKTELVRLVERLLGIGHEPTTTAK